MIRTGDDKPGSGSAARGRGIAIVGMACTYPGARNLSEFWQNIVAGKSAIGDVPPQRWDPEVFFHPQPGTPDKVYCRQGGYLGTSFAFNPLRYGTMPKAVDGGEPDQFLVLRAVHEALSDAGYGKKEFRGARASFVLGRGNYLGAGLNSLIQRGIVTEQTLQILHDLHPDWKPETLADLKREMRSGLPGFGPETAPGLIPNIATGRVANRLDLMGPTFTIDAACASSLIAVDIGVSDLLSQRQDVVLAGGVHVFTDIAFLQVFCAMGALSRSGVIRPFDRDCDGTIPGEGVGIFVLKRLEDAERDGDRIYAVIRGVGTSSDGRAMGVTAPRVEGEELSLRRAYEMCDIDPRTVGLIEAHGTGTPIGDPTEIETLHRVLGSADGGPPTVALGSIKSMIGHAMPAAGAAGLIRTALALYHGVLPATLNCRDPHEQIRRPGSRLYVNAQSRPWIHASSEFPRRAGVNAFGFGGVNAHIVMEEYQPDEARPERPNEVGKTILHADPPTLLRVWDCELCVFEADSREELVGDLRHKIAYLQSTDRVSLADVAFTLNSALRGAEFRLALIASSTADLVEKLEFAAAKLADPGVNQLKDAKGVYFIGDAAARQGKVAFVFPGLGAQYINMLSDLCIHFPLVRRCFENADRAVGLIEGRVPSADVFPPPFFTPDEEKAAADRLSKIERANVSVLTANGAMFLLLDRLDVRPHMATGHSSGEWIALASAGMIDVDSFVSAMNGLDEVWRRLTNDKSVPHRAMLTVGTDRETVARLAAELGRPIEIANDNCRHQVVVVVRPEDVKTVTDGFLRRGVFVEKLPYEHGYHTEEFTYVTEALRRHFAALPLSPPKTPLYSCATAATYPAESDKVVDVLKNTFARPLLFRDTIEAMYRDGARVFVEVGPRSNLTAFIDDNLRGRPHHAISVNHHRRSGLSGLQHALGLLAALHVPMRLDALYERRVLRRLAFDPVADRIVDEDESPGTMRISLCCPKMGVQRRTASIESSNRAVESTEFAVNAARAETQLQPMHNEPKRFVETPPQSLEARETFHAPAEDSTAAKVLRDHFQVMESFLQTQADVMQAYLGGGACQRMATAFEASHAEASSSHAAPVSDVPVENFLEPARLQAIETPPSISVPAETKSVDARAERSVPVPAIQPRASAPSAVSLEQVLLETVSEKTGYPTDMLQLDLDMEADLGIDSIKRVEILGSLQRRGDELSLSAEVDMEEVARLKTLREVLAFLQGSNSWADRAMGCDLPVKAPGIETTAMQLPLAMRVLEHVPGKIAQLERIVTPENDLYLHDHCFDPNVSDADPGRERLCVIPLTMSLEMMAEAASLLCPGLRLVGARNVQATKWIEVEAGLPPVRLLISAVAEQENSVRVTVTKGGEEAASARQRPATLVEATLLFASAFPQTPTVETTPLKNARKPSHTARELYEKRRMFHGPGFQGVTSLDEIGDDGLAAQLTVLPREHMLTGRGEPGFLTDPFLLDAAGQLVGYWPLEYAREGFVLFPVRIKQLSLFRENLSPGVSSACHLRVRQIANRQLRADMDVVSPDGSPWMRIEGWEDWRFYWDEPFYDFWRFPKERVATTPVALPLPPEYGDVECRRMAQSGEMGTSIWENLWAHLIFSREELSEYRSMKDGPRRMQWVFGRTAAKDAVRVWIKRHFEFDLFPADVIIRHDAEGRPLASGDWVERIGGAPKISITHKDSVAVAVAGRRVIGIDLETIAPREYEFEDLAFDEGERSLLSEFTDGDRYEWITRAWCAKEAAGKAMGKGLSYTPRSVRVLSLDTDAGHLVVAPNNGNHGGNGGNGCRRFYVRSIRDGGQILAVAVEGAHDHA